MDAECMQTSDRWCMIVSRSRLRVWWIRILSGRAPHRDVDRLSHPIRARYCSHLAHSPGSAAACRLRMRHLCLWTHRYQGMSWGVVDERKYLFLGAAGIGGGRLRERGRTDLDVIRYGSLDLFRVSFFLSLTLGFTATSLASEAS